MWHLPYVSVSVGWSAYVVLLIQVTLFEKKIRLCEPSFILCPAFEEWCALKKIAGVYTLKTSRPICYRCCTEQYILKGQFYARANVYVSAVMGGCLWTRRTTNTCQHTATKNICLDVKWTFSDTAWEQIWISTCSKDLATGSHALRRYLDSRGGNLEVVQTPQGAFSVCEVGSGQLMQQLQRHHWAVAVTLRLLVQLLLVQENGQRLLPCGGRVSLQVLAQINFQFH